MRYRKTKVFSPSGLSVQLVWFDDFLWPDGLVMFRTELEAFLYIQFVTLMLDDDAA